MRGTVCATIAAMVNCLRQQFKRVGCALLFACITLSTLPAMAQADDAKACIDLLYSGENDAAYPVCKRAAEQGDANAQNELAWMYLQGNGVAKNEQTAAKWLRAAAEQGNHRAQHAIGMLYYQGIGVTQDKEEAIGWFRKAAEQGVSKSQLLLGRLYHSGNGVPQSYREAAKWYRQAAELGSHLAQYQLARLYAAGEGVAQNNDEAIKWMQQPARLGYADAPYWLGELYTRGGDMQQAYVWLLLAQQQGHGEANALLTQTKAHLTAAQVKVAEEEAARHAARGVY